jgi:hypothetical protein
VDAGPAQRAEDLVDQGALVLQPVFLIPGVDFMKPFRPKFAEKTNLVKYNLVIMTLPNWLINTFKIYIRCFWAEMCSKFEDENLSETVSAGNDFF